MHSETKTLESNTLDKACILCSGACAIHCMLAPIIALASPAIAHFFENEWIHIGLLVLLTPIAIIAFYRGFKLHQETRPVFLGSAGIVLLLMAVSFELLFKIEVESLEIIFTMIGSILLIVAHICNIKYLRLT